MRRREFMAMLGSAALASPHVARAQAQQTSLPVIGFLNGASRDGYVDRLNAFRQGLGEAGYVEGRNVAIEYRWADDQLDRLSELANDLVRRQVNLIAAGPNLAAALAAKVATTTIPIVFVTGVDPVKSGLVTSLNRPGSNLTGITVLSTELVPKQLELLRELIPTAKVFALLVNPTNPAADMISKGAEEAARSMGLQLRILPASAERDFDPVFAALPDFRADALVISADVLFTAKSTHLATLALRYAMPTVSAFRDYALAGGLMIYGGSLIDQGRQAGIYAGRILKGEKPADLPVMQATKVELVLNLKTAKALGLTMPTALLVRADEVIE